MVTFALLLSQPLTSLCFGGKRANVEWFRCGIYVCQATVGSSRLFSLVDLCVETHPTKQSVRKMVKVHPNGEGQGADDEQESPPELTPSSSALRGGEKSATRGSARQAAQRSKQSLAPGGSSKKGKAGVSPMSRYDSSLGLLTRKFTNLIQVSHGLPNGGYF